MDIVTGLIGALVGAYITAIYAERAIRDKQREKLVEYLRSLAKCLKEMAESLAQNKVPTLAGNNLEKTINDFDAVLDSAAMNEVAKQELQVIQGELRQSLADGIFLDDVIRGKILDTDSKIKENKLGEMQRLSGYLEGLATTVMIKGW